MFGSLCYSFKMKAQTKTIEFYPKRQKERKVSEPPFRSSPPVKKQYQKTYSQWAEWMSEWKAACCSVETTHDMGRGPGGAGWGGQVRLHVPDSLTILLRGTQTIVSRNSMNAEHPFQFIFS